MEMNSSQVEAIVKQVLSQLNGSAPAANVVACKGSQEIPKTAHVAMLTALETVEIKEYPMPEVGDDDILVKVEGCGICGTDAHERWRRCRSRSGHRSRTSGCRHCTWSDPAHR